jgi:hypothetical protein
MLMQALVNADREIEILGRAPQRVIDGVVQLSEAPGYAIGIDDVVSTGRELLLLAQLGLSWGSVVNPVFLETSIAIALARHLQPAGQQPRRREKQAIAHVHVKEPWDRAAMRHAQPFPVLTTERLKLRTVQSSDGSFYHQLLSVAEVTRFSDLPDRGHQGAGRPLRGLDVKVVQQR